MRRLSLKSTLFGVDPSCPTGNNIADGCSGGQIKMNVLETADVLVEIKAVQMEIGVNRLKIHVQIRAKILLHHRLQNNKKRFYMNINKIITLMATVLIFLIQGSYGMETINLKSFIKGSGKNISNDLRNIMNEFEKKSFNKETDGDDFFVKNIAPFSSKIKITVTGVVLDESMRPLKNARVSLRQIKDENSEDLSDYNKPWQCEVKVNNDGTFAVTIPSAFNSYKLSGYIANGIYPKPNYELIVSADGYKSETYRFVNINREVLFIAGKMVAVYRNIYKKENRKFPETSEDFSVPKINTESALIFKCILKRE